MADPKQDEHKPEEPGKPDNVPKGPPIHTEGGGDGDPPGGPPPR